MSWDSNFVFPVVDEATSISFSKHGHFEGRPVITIEFLALVEFELEDLVSRGHVRGIVCTVYAFLESFGESACVY